MPNNQNLIDLKNQIKSSIRRNSDRGFVPYGGCNQVCYEMMSIMQGAEADFDKKQAFGIYIMVLLEAVKLISHADTSSGLAGDVIYGCLSEIDKLCQTAAEENHKHFFDTIIKAAKNKAFKDWADTGYNLLKSTVYFVRDQKQAQKVYEVFQFLGTMYDREDYPDKLLIIHGIIERLDGKEAADKYLFDNIHVPELRMIAVENALSAKDYSLAEKLCMEALEKNTRGYFNRHDPWAYYLERLYSQTANEKKLTEMVRFILFHGDTSYYPKLKELYLKQNVWEQKKEPMLQELSKALMPHVYSLLLSEEVEVQKLLEVVNQHKSYILDYGKQLAESFPSDAYRIYEEYIFEEAEEATDRRKYKNVCKIIKNFYQAGATGEAIELIDRLSGMYQRRPAMIEELATLKSRLKRA